MLALLAATRVPAEQDGFPERSLCPSDRSGVDCRYRRKVDSLWLGLHGPSVVALTSRRARGAPACRRVIIFRRLQRPPSARSKPSMVGSITVWSMSLFTRKRIYETQHDGPQLKPLPEPPKPDRGQLRSMQAHRQYLLSV